MEPEEVDEAAADQVDEVETPEDPDEPEEPETPVAPTGGKRLNERTTNVPFEISNAELQFRSKQLAREVNDLRTRRLDLDRHNEAAKSAKKAIETDIESRQAALDTLAEVVRTGREDRTVEVYDVLRGDQNRVVTVRVDNGEEVSTRGMNAAERQQWLRQEEAARQKVLFPGVQPEPIAEGGGAQ